MLTNLFKILGLAFITSASATNILGTGSESSPNPIKANYPEGTITGTINGTVAVVPIPYKLARSIVPLKYGILTTAYKSLIPHLPADSYPLIIKAILDHDLAIPDFQSMHIFFPFVDLLGDGYSSFAYKDYLLITDTNPLAIAGSKAFGTPTFPATFTPNGEAYAYDAASHTTFLNAYEPITGKLLFATSFAAQAKIKPWPLSFYVNVTNQPVFTDGIACDNQIMIYNTTLSTVKTGLRGTVSLPSYPKAGSCSFTDVYGLQTDVAFVENFYVPCESLKGYSGTGQGDRGDGSGGL